MKAHPILSVLLWPFSLIYGATVVARAWMYRSGILRPKRLKGVVISVGNLTTGGTGKTPMVFTLAQRLHDRGKKIGILSRGYKGKVKTDENLPDKPKTSVILSDETWMMNREFERRVTLGVGADRYGHGRALEEKGIEWFLLDDGFQHLQLARDSKRLSPVDTRWCPTTTMPGWVESSSRFVASEIPKPS
ncbi:MAG: tetraacyldisaccharide 4'-kinase [Acidobacteria bacterium]|nr:tetraacyldisaccharide 4'-kinase [Acidobacteriota bacterium]